MLTRLLILFCQTFLHGIQEQKINYFIPHTKFSAFYKKCL